MSYQALYRKFRPQEFEDVKGQEHIVTTLKNQIKADRIVHAYLFCGTRGTGKTTVAKIFAKAVNCEHPVDGSPCGECPSCRAITEGSSMNVIEIDAASNNGVDNIRQIREEVTYRPTEGRYKVYIIDEVHKLSSSSFNALLKTLEEPPAHVLFILATTDPQKVLPTVLSRCLQFNLKQMPPADIVAHLQKILTNENVTFDEEALHLIAKGARGSMRDALSLTDQAIAYSASNVSANAVKDMLGATDAAQIEAILHALIARDGVALVQVAEQMAAGSNSFYDATIELAQVLYRISLAQIVPDALPDDWQLSKIVRELAPQMGADEVQLYYSIVTQAREQLHLAPDPQAGFTMMLLRLLAFAPEQFQADAVKK